jgi:hypothetical protein
MKSKVLWALVALNVCLLACLVSQWVGVTTASAQAAPRVSDYLLLPGVVQASPAQIIYMIDEQNGWLSARTFSGNGMIDMPPLDLNRLFNPKTPRAGGR